MLMTLWSGILSVVTFLLVLGGIVLVHEFGHYLAGRLQGFAIEAFSIGFGPKVFEIKGAYNRWQLRWLLFGGFVKFAGETDDGGDRQEQEAPTPEGPGEFFFAKPRWRRFLVMVMGVVFNALLAYVLFAGLAAVGWEESVLRDRPAVVGWVAQDSPAAKAGVLRGDEIVSIDGRPVPNWEAAREDIALNQKPYTLVVKRAGDRLSLPVTPEMGTFLKQPVADIGVYPALPPVIGGIYPDSPAAKAGLKPGDRLVSLDGETFTYWDEFQRLMAKGAGATRHFIIERSGAAPLDVSITPEWNEQAGRFLVGVAPQETVWVHYGFPGNLVKAFHVTVDQSTLAYRTLKRLLERKVALSALSGPVSIAYITGEVARTGIYNLLMLVAIISLQLAFFNLLPIPGLDGGQMFILAAEGAARRDLPARIKDRILMAGFVLLIGFFAVILFLDVAKFFK